MISTEAFAFLQQPQIALPICALACAVIALVLRKFWTAGALVLLTGLFLLNWQLAFVTEDAAVIFYVALLFAFFGVATWERAWTVIYVALMPVINWSFAAVPTADIVVVNPTHYAVAIRYDENAMAAPRVVAKGVDLMAARIQAIAREAGVPVLEAPPLARALYAHVELDHEVPRALYAAIAQLLAYVYQLKRWVPGRSAAPKAPVDLDVPAAMDPKSAEARDE